MTRPADPSTNTTDLSGSPANDGGVHVRPYQRSDRDAAYAINQANLPALGSFETAAELEAMVGRSRITLVGLLNDRVVGLLICLDHTAANGGRNFDWIKSTLGRFAYVDRIALATGTNGQGIGQALYAELLARLETAPDMAGLSLTCEVNLRPPNPGSVRFHERLGFSEIGRKDHGDKAVIYLARPIAAPPGGRNERTMV